MKGLQGSNGRFDQELTCRICLEESDRIDVIAPCQCRGTSKWVHRECLNRWRATNEDRAFSKCTECLFEYHMISRHTDSVKARRIRIVRYYLLVARDISAALLVTQAVILTAALLTYGLDSKTHTLLKLFHAEAHPSLFYYGAGVFLFLAMVGLLGLLGYFGQVNGDCCRHCHCYNCNIIPDCCVGCPHCGECGAITSTECSAECGPVILVLLGMLAIAGVFMSFFAGIAYIGQVTSSHLHVLQKQGLANDFIVQDLGNGADHDDDAGGIELGPTFHGAYSAVNPISDSHHGLEVGENIDYGYASNAGSAPPREDGVSAVDRTMLRNMGLI